jgi:hypothetical protein
MTFFSNVTRKPGERKAAWHKRKRAAVLRKFKRDRVAKD